MTNLAPFSRSRGNEKSFIKSAGFTLNKTNDLHNIVIMSGSAKRRRLQTEGDPTMKTIQNDMREKLRAPFCKPHQKQAQAEEKVMTKSCEVLLECIKPYKEIRFARRTQVIESTRTMGRVLTTNVVYEQKATRKVKFVSFHEETPLQTVFSHNQKPSSASVDPDSVLQPENDDFNYPDFLKIEHKQKETGKAVSSEDFITRVFTDTGSVFQI